VIDDPMRPIVIGVDLSLRATGIAHVDGTTEVFKPQGDGVANYGLDRIAEIRDHLIAIVTREHELELVMMEGLAYAAHDNNRLLAMEAGIIRMALYDAGCPLLVASPGQLKKYATGTGNASKEAVVDAAQKRLRYEGFDNNEADALWLQAMGWELVGVPRVELPQVHRNALAELFKAVPAHKRVLR